MLALACMKNYFPSQLEMNYISSFAWFLDGFCVGLAVFSSENIQFSIYSTTPTPADRLDENRVQATLHALLMLDAAMTLALTYPWSC